MIILENPDKDLSIQGSNLSDEDMIDILAEKVQAYLDANMGLLMSYLYRLDVREDKIKKALSNDTEESGDRILARLIWERQKQRLETKRTIQSQELIDDEWSW